MSDSQYMQLEEENSLLREKVKSMESLIEKQNRELEENANRWEKVGKLVAQLDDVFYEELHK